MLGEWRDRKRGDYNYRYNGKEIHADFGWGNYYYGARFYDPGIGRFTSVDDLADHLNQVAKSPYAYAWNNPISLTDPDGNCPMCIIPIIWGIAEVAMSAGDVIETTQTLADPNASTSKKVSSVGLTASGFFAPGAGYNKVDDVVEGAVLSLIHI